MATGSAELRALTLSYIAAEMTSALSVGPHRRVFTVYDNTFTGADAVAFLVSRGFAADVLAALNVGNELIAAGHMHHAVDAAQPLKNKRTSLYRLRVHGGTGPKGTVVVTPAATGVRTRTPAPQSHAGSGSSGASNGSLRRSGVPSSSSFYSASREPPGSSNSSVTASIRGSISRLSFASTTPDSPRSRASTFDIDGAQTQTSSSLDRRRTYGDLSSVATRSGSFSSVPLRASPEADFVKTPPVPAVVPAPVPPASLMPAEPVGSRAADGGTYDDGELAGSTSTHPVVRETDIASAGTARTNVHVTEGRRRSSGGHSEVIRRMDVNGAQLDATPTSSHASSGVSRLDNGRNVAGSALETGFDRGTHTAVCTTSTISSGMEPRRTASMGSRRASSSMVPPLAVSVTALGDTPQAGKDSSQAGKDSSSGPQPAAAADSISVPAIMGAGSTSGGNAKAGGGATITTSSSTRRTLACTRSCGGGSRSSSTGIATPNLEDRDSVSHRSVRAGLSSSSSAVNAETVAALQHTLSTMMSAQAHTVSVLDELRDRLSRLERRDGRHIDREVDTTREPTLSRTSSATSASAPDAAALGRRHPVGSSDSAGYLQHRDSDEATATLLTARHRIGPVTAAVIDTISDAEAVLSRYPHRLRLAFVVAGAIVLLLLVQWVLSGVLPVPLPLQAGDAIGESATRPESLGPRLERLMQLGLMMLAAFGAVVYLQQPRVARPRDTLREHPR